jgi:hypothetical protein
MPDPLQIDAIRDALRRRRPDQLAELDTRFPGLKLRDGPRRTLGNGDDASPATPGRVADLARLAAEEAEADLRETLAVLQGKTRLLGRLRLVSAAATAIASASMVALVLGNDGGTLLVAAVSLCGSLISLFLGYLEDFSGGEGSIRQFRDGLANEQRRLVLATAELRLGDVTGDDALALAALKEINAVLAEVQFVRAKLGLPV